MISKLLIIVVSSLIAAVQCDEMYKSLAEMELEMSQYIEQQEAVFMTDHADNMQKIDDLLEEKRREIEEVDEKFREEEIRMNSAIDDLEEEKQNILAESAQTVADSGEMEDYDFDE